MTWSCLKIFILAIRPHLKPRPRQWLKIKIRQRLKIKNKTKTEDKNQTRNKTKTENKDILDKTNKRIDTINKSNNLLAKLKAEVTKKFELIYESLSELQNEIFSHDSWLRLV